MSTKLIVGLLIIFLALIAGFSLLPTPAQAPEEETTTEEPAKTETGGQTSTVTTKKPSASTSSSSQAGKRLYENGVYLTIIEHTDAGFSPASLEIKAGEEVRFVNKSNLSMYVGSNTVTSHVEYGAYKQPATVGYGGVYQVALTKPGLWEYYNINSNPRKGGVILVK